MHSTKLIEATQTDRNDATNDIIAAVMAASANRPEYTPETDRRITLRMPAVLREFWELAPEIQKVSASACIGDLVDAVRTRACENKDYVTPSWSGNKVLGARIAITLLKAKGYGRKDIPESIKRLANPAGRRGTPTPEPEPVPMPEPTPEPEPVPEDEDDWSDVDADDSGWTPEDEDEPTPEPESEPEPVPEEPKLRHAKYDQILWLLKNHNNVYAYGPAGTGKTSIGEDMARDIPARLFTLASPQMKEEVLGFKNAQGSYTPSVVAIAIKYAHDHPEETVELLLEEMDRSAPEALVGGLNTLLASGFLPAPASMEESEEYGNFKIPDNMVIFATGNTVGNGSTEDYGAEMLDMSFLDRFAAIYVDYDRRIEMKCARDDAELVEFIHSLRKAQDETGVGRFVISYRSISRVADLIANMPRSAFTKEYPTHLSEVLAIGLVKGQLPVDTLKTITSRMPDNKYTKALRALSKVA